MKLSVWICPVRKTEGLVFPELWPIQNIRVPRTWSSLFVYVTETFLGTL
jgi:hypothetical protein